MSKIITLSKGKSAIVDDSDFEWLNQWKWFAKEKAGHTAYAARGVYVRGKQNTIRMHRIILGLIKGDAREVDHINGNGLDNRRCNLRIATSAQNKINCGKRSTNTSGYKGVFFDKNANKWRAQISIRGKNKFLGFFDEPEIAAHAYDDTARKIYGEFARLNFD